MNEIRQCRCLTNDDREILKAAASVMDRLEGLHARDGAVLFDSCDQYYVGMGEMAEALRSLAKPSETCGER